MPIPRPLLDVHQAFGARLQGDRIDGYGDPAAEDQALRESCGLVDRSDRGKLRLTGSERVDFLHGQVTNDLKALRPGLGAYAALLTPKGHLVADARILLREGDALLDTEPGREAAVREVLERHLISEDVELADVTGDFALFSLIGPRAAELAGASPDEHAHEERDGLLAVGTRLGALPGVDLWVPSARAPETLRALIERGRPLGLSLVGHAALEIARVEAGVPRFGADMDEETIPLEARLEGRAISFTKGCYVGQEVIARASYRGGVRRKLAGFRLDAGPLPPAHTQLFKAPGETKAMGELTSPVLSPRFGPVALGYARREHDAIGAELVTADGRKATICALPFG